MASSANNESPNANYETTLPLVADVSEFYGYSELSQKILEDFLRDPNSTEWNFPPSTELGMKIQMEHLAFEQRCYRFASHLIKDYTGGTWGHSPNGIYCIKTEPDERLHYVNAMNYSDEIGNSLEVGLAITLIALDGAMASRNQDFANAMVFFRSTLMQIIEEQFEAGGTFLNTGKVIRMID